ncbi:RRM domain-containing protein [Psidium guajava]|nr:RRM domain-containing protein [Psidium guajava]
MAQSEIILEEPLCGSPLAFPRQPRETWLVFIATLINAKAVDFTACEENLDVKLEPLIIDMKEVEDPGKRASLRSRSLSISHLTSSGSTSSSSPHSSWKPKSDLVAVLNEFQRQEQVPLRFASLCSFEIGSEHFKSIKVNDQNSLERGSSGYRSLD